MTSVNALSKTRKHWVVWSVLLTLPTYILLPLYLATALDMNRLQVAFRRMGGKPQIFIEWQKLLRDNREVPIPDKLKQVNDFFNRTIEFGEDQEVWGQLDYWATPMESLSKERGDCEDYVIAKYFALLNLNVPNDRLRLIYVKALISGQSGTSMQAHMVLAYYPSPDAEPMLLDNLISDIRPAARRPDLLPIFSFNNQGIYTGVSANANLGSGGVGRLTRWQDLLQRAHDEGFD
ncbi:MAG: transglutaminase-like cysteine peptidase [Burkholderiaceae bacterium]